jgi:hypothetical protein
VWTFLRAQPELEVSVNRRIIFGSVRHSIFIPRVALVVAIVGTALCTSASGVQKQNFYPPTGFGGYKLDQAVREIGATWRVPEISSKSPGGHASTWIGVQSSDGDFIQLGVTEDQTLNETPVYQAFWSDTSMRFEPQFLGSLSRREFIVASLAQTKRGWTLKLVYPSNHTSISKTIRYGAKTTFSTGEWLQENPPSSLDEPTDSPYPIMSVPHFTKLKMNNEAPDLSVEDAQVLIPSNRPSEVPTRTVNDSFTFVEPEGAELEYLDDARLLDDASSSFNYEISKWSDLSHNARLAAIRTYINALVRNDKEFDSGSWPEPSQTPINDLVANFRVQVSDLKAWLTTNLSDNNVEFERFIHRADLETKFADSARASLGLPPT